MAGLGWFVAGTLFGSAGLKALKSKDAKKVYSKAVSYGLDIKDYVMETADNLKEGWDDVYAEAQDIKEKRDLEREAEAEAEIIEDTSEVEDAPRKTTSAKRTTGKSTTAAKNTTRKSTASSTKKSSPKKSTRSAGAKKN